MGKHKKQTLEQKIKIVKEFKRGAADNNGVVLTLIIKAIIIVSSKNILFNPSYIEKALCAITNEIMARMKLITPVIIDDKVTFKNFHIIISLQTNV